MYMAGAHVPMEGVIEEGGEKEGERRSIEIFEINEALKKEQLRHRTNDAVSNYLDEIQRIYGSNY